MQLKEDLHNNMETNILKRFKSYFTKRYSYLTRWTKFFWMAYQKNWLLDPATEKRAKYWRKCGAHIGEGVNIGYDVYFDASNAAHIYIEDEVWIASRSLVLCHKRDTRSYNIGSKYQDLPYQHKDVILKKGCCIGMGCIIMPGVTIGEGAMIGAGSIVTRDIPAWTVAVGSPAKVVKDYKIDNKR